LLTPAGQSEVTSIGHPIVNVVVIAASIAAIVLLMR
jgi:hypothetical protein